MSALPRSDDFACWFYDFERRISVWCRDGGHEMTIAYGDQHGNEVCRWIVPGTWSGE